MPTKEWNTRHEYIHFICLALKVSLERSITVESSRMAAVWQVWRVAASSLTRAIHASGIEVRVATFIQGVGGSGRLITMSLGPTTSPFLLPASNRAKAGKNV